MSRIPKSAWSHCSLKNRGSGQSKDLGLLLLQLSTTFMTSEGLIFLNPKYLFSKNRQTNKQTKLKVSACLLRRFVVGISEHVQTVVSILLESMAIAATVI